MTKRKDLARAGFTDAELTELSAKEQATINRLPPGYQMGPGKWNTVVSRASDENEKYRQEFAADRQTYERAGMTEGSYIAMRRVDDGIDWCDPRQAGEAPPPASAAAMADELARQPAGKSYECGSEHFLA